MDEDVSTASAWNADLVGEGVGRAVGCLRVRPFGRPSAPTPVNSLVFQWGDGWLVVV